VIKRIKKALQRRKVKIFLIFLLCATLAWFISKLFETYEHTTDFNIDYVNVPDDLLLISASHEKVKIKLSGAGFQFFQYSALGKKVKIDLSNMDGVGVFSIPPKETRRQLEDQLSRPMTILDVDNDTLFFDFRKLASKKVPVVLDLNFNLAQNHMMDGTMTTDPDSIIIQGLTEEIESITEVNSDKIELIDVDENFTVTANLLKSKNLKFTEYSSNEVEIRGRVFKFSEKNISVPIDAINLPEGRSIKMFPNTVNILCKGNLDVLKKLTNDDFNVVADYNSIDNLQTNVIPIKILKKPSELHSAILKEIEIEYILERIE